MVRSRGTNTLKHRHEKHENMQLSLKTTPSGVLLQGSGGISQASLDLSSSSVFGYQESARKLREKKRKSSTTERRKLRA